MTSYFWSGFPSLSGRSDVMYGRRHIGGTDPPVPHVTPIGSDSYAIVPPIAYRPLSRVTSFPRLFVLVLGLVESARLTSRSYTRSRTNESSDAPICGRSSHTRRGGTVLSSRARTKIEISFRLDGDTQLCINPGYGAAYACTANWPGQAARRGYISIIRGNYYERPSSSILIFCSRPPPRRGKD